MNRLATPLKGWQLSSLAGCILMMAGQVVTAESIPEPRSVIASQITEQSVESLQRQGPDAIGGIGDWFFSNGTLCAVISAVEHEGEFSSKGGSLVDLGFCNRADDHFSFTHDLLNGSRRRPLDADSISIEEHHGQPSIVVESSTDGAKLTTRYWFDDRQATQLKISKRYQYAAGEEVNFLSPLNFNYHSLEPFVFNSRNPELSNGFQNQDFVKRGVGAIRESARHADTLITLSPRSADIGIAYGWQLTQAQRVEADERYDVPYFMLADTDGTAMMVLTDTFYVGDGESINWLKLPQIPLLSLEPGTAVETEEIVFVGNRGDVAAITDQMLVTEATVHGSINAQGAIHIRQANGAPLTHVVPDLDGKFSFKAPAGKYTLKAIAYGNRVFEQAFTVNNENQQQLEPITLPAAATVSLPRGQAMRLLFVGLEGTANPDFAGNLTESSVEYGDHTEMPDPISAVYLAGVSGDKTEVSLAPGKYRVYATRGPEFSLEKTQIEVVAGQKVNLDITIPQRVISTPNYIASDLHVHSGLSFDNTFAETERVRTFVAEHGEVMVSSEHDLPTDYAPYLKAMGVEDKIVSIPGAEVTSLLPTERNKYTGGHTNYFPYEPDHHHFRNGMINHENKRLREIFHEVRKTHPHAVVQLNHPRHDLRLSGEKLPSDWQDIIDNGNYLDHMGTAAHPYNPHKHLHTEPNNVLIEKDPETGLRDIDFDLIEVINPGGDNHHDRLKAVRMDWLSFVKQGERIVATANSDSHNAHEQVAVPRTMVKMDDDRVTHFKREQFIHNLKHGNAYGTTGPMLEVSLLEATLGDTFAGQRAPLTVTISKAPWIDVERLEIQINGKSVDTHTLNNDAQQTLIIPLEFNKDSFVTVEVFGTPSEDYALIYPEISPYAFSNPIYVDFDQDGEWLAPGL